MADKTDAKRPRWKSPRWILAGLLIYVLSLGPASFLVDRGYLPKNPLNPLSVALMCFYLPLNIVTEIIPPLDHLKKWYLSNWDRRYQ